MASTLDKAKEFVADKIAHIPKPEATLADVSVKSFSRKAVTLRSDVAVTNPYNHRLPICEVSLSICTRGSNVIRITNPLQGGSVGYVGRDWDIDYELEFTIPLSTKGELKLPTLKDIF